MEEKKKPTKKIFSRKRILLLAIGGIFSLLIMVYLAVAVYFKGHYLPGTRVNSMDCGGKTPDYLTRLNEENIRDYLLTFYDRKGTAFRLRGLDISYSYIPTGEEERLLREQNAYSWPVSLFQPKDYHLTSSTSYDSSALENFVMNLSLFSEDYIEQPQNAYLSIENGGYSLVTEVLGSSPLAEQILVELKSAVESGQTQITLSDACYLSPEITTEDPSLKENLALLEKYLNATIHYEIEDVEENLSREEILDLIAFDESGKIQIDEKKLTKFVQHLATTYNTYGDVREFHTSSGDVVKIGGGDYGWVIAKTKEAEQIRADLENGQPVSREPVYEQRAKKSGPDDIGDTYVELDYTKQHLWYYIDGELFIDSDIVTGNLSKMRGSPDGIYKIVYKQRNTVLVGEDYASPVDYFMPFAYNVGLHDASWRSSFGGEIYRTSGSRGCVNIPRDVVEKIFDVIEVGTPVVAYYREPVTLISESAKISNAYSYVKPPEAP